MLAGMEPMPADPGGTPDYIDDEATAWQAHAERELYNSQWVTLSMVDVELPDGQRFEHHVVRMPDAAIAAAIDDEDRVLLMWGPSEPCVGPPGVERRSLPRWMAGLLRGQPWSEAEGAAGQ
jgi:hypothetical protein